MTPRSAIFTHTDYKNAVAAAKQVDADRVEMRAPDGTVITIYLKNGLEDKPLGVGDVVL